MSTQEFTNQEGKLLAWLLGVAMLVSLGGLQATALACWGPIRVDLLLVMTIAWAALAGPRVGLIFGLLAGAMEDILVGEGIHFLILRSIIGLLAGTVRPVLNVRRTIIILPLVVMATLLQEGILAIIHHNWLRFDELWLLASLANLAVAWPIYVITRA
ncbi:MAG: rod shape-determining protein MreD, partial [Cyanobacteria bacterium NC_groundwater_1444_Ag_S-0.65um_54_12]|nr:rod shape-determining protein MreD [Cyanobacteria bacterium NC_groundwater_1444_Ag_S-0.65um_54_12]